MAIQSVLFKINGQTYNLAYNSAQQAYTGTITAPAGSSYNENDDHMYHGEIVATDTANNSVTATVTDFAALGLRVLEKVKPTIVVMYPAAEAFITTNKPTIRWRVVDSDSGIDSSTIGIKIDSGAVITSGITKTPVTNGYDCQYTPASAMSEGSHTLSFDVTDNDGNNATTTTVTFKVDTVPPTLNVTQPIDNLVTNNATLTVVGVTNDAVSSPVTLTVNGTNVTVESDGSFSTTVTLTEGENTITVIAVDSAGKSTTVVRTVVLDTVPPVINSVTIAPNPVDAGATYVVTVTVE